MEFSDAIELIRHPESGNVSRSIWADLGCGSGLFSFALAALLPEGSHIYAIDKNPVSLNKHSKPAQTIIQPQQADFVTQELSLPPLDGILMANSLHYVKDKISCLTKLSTYLKENGAYIIVEYNTETANRWVPYPIRFETLKDMFATLGYTKVNKLREKPSLYGRANLYAAYISR
ncbi:class I SAM-dependent methyltransferase [Rhodocytophaga rosea]|uniref:Class I SAM-dependent methyltransferase n=1 Tax=Rhodocytophaga rosea TaxID=2704465 RepID=A0A6C0GSY0_9BACT|nr:methyltransferase domain-containing protein [Rhodocytophaga rosea]QHT70914.1 class I SAM-dependent methyltransferase [Rhodocytophaga rosea]